MHYPIRIANNDKRNKSQAKSILALQKVTESFLKALIKKINRIKSIESYQCSG